jgi:hypothetical protein
VEDQLGEDVVLPSDIKGRALSVALTRLWAIANIGKDIGKKIRVRKSNFCNTRLGTMSSIV